MQPITPDGIPIPQFIPWFPVRQTRHDWSPDVQRLFIALLTTTGSARIAAKAVRRSIRSAYQLRDRSGAESFAAAWTEAAARGHDMARLAALERMPTDERLALALIGTRDSGAAAFGEHHYRLEQAEFAAARRMLDLAGIATSPATIYRDIDQYALWQAETKREARRLARADMRATIRRAAAFTARDGGPRVRSL